MQRGLRVITLQGAIEKSPILLSQYWKHEWLDGNINISHFGGSNNIFADCKQMLELKCSYQTIFDPTKKQKKKPFEEDKQFYFKIISKPQRIEPKMMQKKE